ncbi:hypothetical protein FHG87_012505 [Trinorchestia longiramus]|nr:hypothetical protein FHG87_012505 [Trinorchestia longiramus]
MGTPLQEGFTPPAGDARRSLTAKGFSELSWLLAGSRAQPTALYNEAVTLCVTFSLPSPSKVNISTMNSHHLKNSTHSQQQSKGSRNQPFCLQTGWGLNNPRAIKTVAKYRSNKYECVRGICKYVAVPSIMFSMNVMAWNGGDLEKLEMLQNMVGRLASDAPKYLRRY